MLYKIYLEKKYNLIRAENGEEAISKFWNIVLLLFDGYRYACGGRLSGNGSNSSIVIQSTYCCSDCFAYDEDKRKVMSRGFNGYLSKPLNKEALFDMLRQMGI